MMYYVFVLLALALGSYLFLNLVDWLWGKWLDN